MSLATGESVLATYFNLFRSWYMRRALVNSLITGVLSAVLAVFVGFIMAYTVTRVNIPFKKFFNMVAIIPVISPPFVSGLSILLLFGNNGFVTYHLLGIRFPHLR